MTTKYKAYVTFTGLSEATANPDVTYEIIEDVVKVVEGDAFVQLLCEDQSVHLFRHDQIVRLDCYPIETSAQETVQ